MNNLPTNMNVASILLEKLGIRYSREFLQKTMEELPYDGSLWVLERTMKVFGVPCEGLKVEKEELLHIPVPFVASTSTGLLVVVSIAENQIGYVGNNIALKSYDYSSFCELWNGDVLLPKSTLDSGELKAKKHQKEKFNRKFSSCIRYVCTILCLAAFVWSQKDKLCILMQWDTCAYLVLCMVGLLLSFLLLREQLFLGGTISQKLCNSLKNGSCRNVLHSAAAKTIGGYSWSEVGFSYFFACMLTLTTTSYGMGFLSFLSLIALPYTLWSIWYQKFKLHQWCILCLMVQAILVLSACATICSGTFHMHVIPFIVWSIAFITALTIVNWQASILIKGRFAEEWEKSYKRLKYSNGIVETLAAHEAKLLQEPALESSIVFGNRNAECHIIVFSNLHCVTCAQLHEVLCRSDLERCCIRYYFTTLTTEYTHAARKAIACYLQHGEKAASAFLTSWYKAVEKEEKPIDSYTDLNLKSTEVSSELAIHTAWMKVQKLVPTPTIFINGAKLPSFYTLEDLTIILP